MGRMPHGFPQGAVKKGPTIRDVAAAEGVSVSVVSRVLNPDSGPAAPANRQEVRRSLMSLATVRGPQPANHALTVGLVVTDLSNPFFARLAARIV
jgi:LacI family transcriptional regulator